MVRLMTAAITLLAVSSLHAQTAPAFDVATVKPASTPSGDLIRINPGTIYNGRVTFKDASLSDCLKFAWGIIDNAQIVGPAWVTSKAVRFDIVAQFPPGTSRDQILLMVRNLLAERLKLKLHQEQRNLPYLAMTVAKNGPKFKPDGQFEDPSPIPSGWIRLSNRMTMRTLSTLLSRYERQTFIDMTGLEGEFAINLQWLRGADQPPDAEPGPGIFTALQEQLGLRLEARKGPLDVLVIDNAEQTPAEN
jgi:uncharacterized protein (TIGR03435 family)